MKTSKYGIYMPPNLWMYSLLSHLKKQPMKTAMQELIWNIKSPKDINNYIVDRGADGVSLGWWNGIEWIKMWGSEKINVYGWIQMPIHKEQILNQKK